VKIAASRGTIFDKHGKKLAWSQKNYDLCLDLKKIHSQNQKDHILKQLKKVFPDLELSSEEPLLQDEMVIKRDLTPNELMVLQKMLSDNPALTIRPIFKRITVNNPAVKKYIGKAEFINGKWVGLSGIEKKYNSYLNGTDGLYTFMQDKRGRWIEGSVVCKKRMIPGTSLYLCYKLVTNIYKTDM
jgi:cell division protein FtsI/penicillin-binding protein 2